jgi:hypothetical protein
MLIAFSLKEILNSGKSLKRVDENHILILGNDAEHTVERIFAVI